MSLSVQITSMLGGVQSESVDRDQVDGVGAAGVPVQDASEPDHEVVPTLRSVLGDCDQTDSLGSQPRAGRILSRHIRKRYVAG